MRHKSFYIYTFGCQMNVHDSEQMGALLRDSGCRPAADPAAADIVIVNTCSIREKADQKAHSLLGRLRRMKQKNPRLIVGVAGCLAQQWGEEFARRIPGLDLVVGTHNIHLIPEMIARVQTCGAPLVETSFRDEVNSIGIFAPPGNGAVSAFVTVMQGCDNFCAYCVVPYLRGREQSRRPEDILGEIGKLAGRGISEVTLLGQNVNSYGVSFGNGYDFASLLRDVAGVKGVERIRFTTSHPKDLSERIARCFAEIGSLCEHIHLPVQSGSDSVLTAMNRGYRAAEYIKKVDKLRQMCSNISVTSDIIVGFPGETEEDFRHTIRLMERVRFDGLFSFRYSDRPGTAAAKFAAKVEDKVKRERLSELQRLQDGITLEKHEAAVGSVEEILIEGYSRNSRAEISGRTRTNKIVNLEGGPEWIGKTVPVRIEKAYLHSLRGKLV
ncbi:MAG: tRNA (N6-isopentenyl adenosine(37)-C2)-methylthiotransferase MiaB [Syntrophales bacterium]